MFPYTCVEMSGGLTDIASCTACARKFVNRSVTQYVTGNYVRSTGEQAPNTFYFKLPYIGYFSSIAQKRIRRLSHFYCNNANIVLAFSSFKVGSLFSVKDPFTNGLRSCVVSNFRAQAVQLAMSVRPPDISTHV